MKIERGDWTTFKKMEGRRPALGTLWEIRSGGLFMLTAFEHPAHGKDMVSGEAVSDGYCGCGVDVEVREVRLGNACMALDALGKPSRQPEAPVDVAYTNHRGETRTRRIIPRRVWYGSTEWYPTEHWFVDALDVEKGEMRSFALDRFGEPRVSLAREEWRAIYEFLQSVKEPVAERAHPDDGTMSILNVVKRIHAEREASADRAAALQVDRDALYGQVERLVADNSRAREVLSRFRNRTDAVVDTQAGDLVNYVDAADLEAVDQFFDERSRSGAPEEEFGG